MENSMRQWRLIKKKETKTFFSFIFSLFHFDEFFISLPMKKARKSLGKVFSCFWTDEGVNEQMLTMSLNILMKTFFHEANVESC